MIGIAGCSCGECCRKAEPCERCLGDTLAANGIPRDKIEQFRGLKNKGGAYQYPWDFSELCQAIRSFIKKGEPVSPNDKIEGRA